MEPTLEDIKRAAEEQVEQLYKNKLQTLENSCETAQKAISNNISDLIKKQKKKERIIKIVCWTLIILSMMLIYSGL